MDRQEHTTATVHVWVAPLAVPPAVQAELVSSLSPDEHRRAEAYRDPADGDRYAVARGWLRYVLARHLPTAAADVPLGETPGKPRLTSGQGPCFNLSHAGDLVAVAVCDREVGVDVERCDDPRTLEAAPVACSGGELAALERLPAEGRLEAFLSQWTAKEAYLKARGVGLALPPDRVQFGRRVDGASPVHVTGERGGPRWWVRPFRPAPGYVGAVAAEGVGWTVVVRNVATGPSSVRAVAGSRLHAVGLVGSTVRCTGVPARHP